MQEQKQSELIAALRKLQQHNPSQAQLLEQEMDEVQETLKTVSVTYTETFQKLGTFQESIARCKQEWGMDPSN